MSKTEVLVPCGTAFVQNGHINGHKNFKSKIREHSFRVITVIGKKKKKKFSQKSKNVE
jgi:hypothetical protein